MKISIRRGLTLIELTVVLLILAATAGVLVPRLVGYSGRAHGASGSSNIQEVSKAIALFEANTGAQPDGWDSLLQGADGARTPYLATVEAPATPPIVAGALNAAEADALTAIGVTSINNMDDGTGAGFNATFSPNDGTAEAIADTAEVALLSPTAITGLGLATGNRYVTFGLGNGVNMIGSVMLDAPVHFPEGGEKPESVYLRWYVVYDLGDGVDTPERARFVGVFGCEPDSGEMTNLGAHLGEYFEARDS